MGPDSLFFSLLLSVITTYLAKVSGFFYFPHLQKPKGVSLLHLLGAFLTYVIVSLLFVPLLYLFLKFFIKDGATLKPVLQSCAFWVLFLSMIGYLQLLKRKMELAFLWEESNPAFLKNVGWGVVGWIVSYPVVTFVNLAIARISSRIWGKQDVEQEVVKYLKSFIDRPVIFIMLTVGIVFIIPFIEELLFRGFIQSWLRKYLSRGFAIALSSLIFAGAHFSMGLRVGNIELVGTLFVLSCYLGFLYERQRNIFASYGLHMTFNGVTVVVLLFQNA